jgi:hypothetical protein
LKKDAKKLHFVVPKK